MGESVLIRRYEPGEEPALFDIYFSAIHLVASRDYTDVRIQAWAPGDTDAALWKKKMREINPFVAELHGELVGYADVQSSGYIDHFFVSGKYPRRGIGSHLMKRLVAHSISGGVRSLKSYVSRTAQPFFAKFEFILVKQRSPKIRGVVIPNALMSRSLSNEA